MKKAERIPEKELCEIWKSLDKKNRLNTISGETVILQNPGVHNADSSGPDFRNAKISIGSFTFVGDIEIDYDINDWKSHGHNLDKNYNKVILHASLINKNSQPYVFTRDGRKVMSVCLSDFINPELLNEISNAEPDKSSSNNLTPLRCEENVNSIQPALKTDFIKLLGTQRFNRRCQNIHRRLRELVYLREINLQEPIVTYDLPESFYKREFTGSDFDIAELWQQLLYELIFEALGYTKNKNTMMNLAKAVNIRFLRSAINDGNIIPKLQACLFNVSGLIPENKELDSESRNYADCLFRIWSDISVSFTGQKFNETDWHFFRLRPHNFPTVRIAGGTVLLKKILHDNLIGSMIKKIKEIRNPHVLIQSLKSIFIVKSEGFWKNHYVFDSRASNEIKYFIGISRVEDIMVNVVFPFCSVYFEIFDTPELSRKMLKLYTINIQESDNSIVNHVAGTMELEKLKTRSIISQGMIELFRNYCTKNRCLECDIGKSVFN